MFSLARSIPIRYNGHWRRRLVLLPPQAAHLDRDAPRLRRPHVKSSASALQRSDYAAGNARIAGWSPRLAEHPFGRTMIKERMSEERLEIIETQVHRKNDLVAIELCREIRRLQARVAELAEELRRRR